MPLIDEFIWRLAPIDQQKTMHPMSGGYASSNGMALPSTNEATDMANFYTKQRLTQSTPGSPQDHGRPTSIEVVGSAESLVGRVIISFITFFFAFSHHVFSFISIFSIHFFGA